MVFIICKIPFLSGQQPGSSSVFLQIKTLVEIERRSCHANRQLQYKKSSFHRLPSKSKRPSMRKQIASSLLSHFIVSLCLQNIHLQRDIQQTYLCQYFRKFLQSIKKTFRKLLKSSQKTPLAKSYFSKVVGFYGSSRPKCLEKCVLRKVFAEFTGKHLCQGLYFSKVTGLRL